MTLVLTAVACLLCVIPVQAQTFLANVNPRTGTTLLSIYAPAAILEFYNTTLTQRIFNPAPCMKSTNSEHCTVQQTQAAMLQNPIAFFGSNLVNHVKAECGITCQGASPTPVFAFATDADLAKDTIAYPNIIKMIPDGFAQGAALCYLFKTWKWTRVGLLSGETSDVSSTVTGLRTTCGSMNITIIQRLVPGATPNDAAVEVVATRMITELKGEGVYVIVFAVPNSIIPQCARAGLATGITRAPYQHVGVWEWMRRADIVYGDNTTRKFMKGIVGLTLDKVYEPWWSTFVNNLRNSSAKSILAGVPIPTSASTYFDTAEIARRGFEQVVALNNTCARNTTADVLCPRLSSKGIKHLFMEFCVNNTYDLSGGHIQFDSKLVRMGFFTFVNDPDGEGLVPLGIVTQTGDGAQTVGQPTWTSGLTETPLDFPRLMIGERVELKLDAPFVIAAVFSCLLMSWVGTILLEHAKDSISREGEAQVAPSRFQKWMKRYGWTSMSALSFALAQWSSSLFTVFAIHFEEAQSISARMDVALVSVALLVAFAAWEFGLLSGLHASRTNKYQLVAPEGTSTIAKARALLSRAAIFSYVSAALATGGSLACLAVVHSAYASQASISWEAGWVVLVGISAFAINCVAMYPLLTAWASLVRYTACFSFTLAVSLLELVAFSTSMCRFSSYNAPEASADMSTLSITVFSVLGGMGVAFIVINVLVTRTSLTAVLAEMKRMRLKIADLEGDVAFSQRMSAYHSKRADWALFQHQLRTMVRFTPGDGTELVANPFLKYLQPVYERCGHDDEKREASPPPKASLLDELLDTPVFMEMLVRTFGAKHCQETIECLFFIRLYKDIAPSLIVDGNAKASRDLAEFIYKRFVEEGSVCQVNLGNGMPEEIKRDIHSKSETKRCVEIFARADTELYTLAMTNGYEQTSAVVQLLKNLKGSTICRPPQTPPKGEVKIKIELHRPPPPRKDSDLQSSLATDGGLSKVTALGAAAPPPSQSTGSAIAFAEHIANSPKQEKKLAIATVL